LPAIGELYRKGYVAEGICGSLLSVARDMNTPAKPWHKEKLLSITGRYHQIVTTWSGYQEDAEPNDIPPVAAFSPKTGRNDPCPCGSGKKYKKCCMAADLNQDQ